MDGIEPKASQEEMEAVRDTIARGNHVAARDKLLKLQQKFPAIDEFKSMISVCDVLNSANFDFLDGETDWYLVLQAPQAASQQDVEYQYNKISTHIEPIKDHFPCAQSALNIVKEAYCVLSNPEKRSAFDKKRTTMFEACALMAEHIVTNNKIPKTRTTSKFASDKRDVNISGMGPNNGHDHEKVFSVHSDGMFELDHYAGTVSSDSITKSFEPENNKSDLKDLACNQIWAVRDNDPEAMPRRYVVLNNVTPQDDTDMFVTFLEPNPMCAEEKHWVERGLPLACGSFKEGKTIGVLGLNQFGHIVKCERSQDDSSYSIYPKKGEVWAMYRNWNSKWEISDFTNCCQYRIVEIVQDLSDDGSEILAASLVEVRGFVTLFEKERSNNEYELIPRAAFLSFSHRIVASRVQATEDNGIFTPFWEIEPDSLGCLNVASLENVSSMLDFTLPVST